MVYEIRTTNVFDKWLIKLKDKTAVNRIMSRIYRMEQGNLGDVKTVDQNLKPSKKSLRLLVVSYLLCKGFE